MLPSVTPSVDKAEAINCKKVQGLQGKSENQDSDVTCFLRAAHGCDRLLNLIFGSVSESQSLEGSLRAFEVTVKSNLWPENIWSWRKYWKINTSWCPSIIISARCIGRNGTCFEIIVFSLHKSPPILCFYIWYQQWIILYEIRIHQNGIHLLSRR